MAQLLRALAASELKVVFRLQRQVRWPQMPATAASKDTLLGQLQAPMYVCICTHAHKKYFKHLKTILNIRVRH